MAVATLGAMVTWSLYISTVNSELSLSKNAFRASMAPVLLTFQTYMNSQIRALCATADALSSHPTMPSLHNVEMVRREA